VQISVVAVGFEICAAKIQLREVARKERETKSGLCCLPIFAVWDLAIYEECTYLWSAYVKEVTNDTLVMWDGSVPGRNTLYVTVIIPLKSFRQCSALSDCVFVNFWYLIVQSGTETDFWNSMLWWLIDYAVTWEAHWRMPNSLTAAALWRLVVQSRNLMFNIVTPRHFRMKFTSVSAVVKFRQFAQSCCAWRSEIGRVLFDGQFRIFPRWIPKTVWFHPYYGNAVTDAALCVGELQVFNWVSNCFFVAWPYRPQFAWGGWFRLNWTSLTSFDLVLSSKH